MCTVAEFCSDPVMVIVHTDNLYDIHSDYYLSTGMCAFIRLCIHRRLIFSV